MKEYVKFRNLTNFTGVKLRFANTSVEKTTKKLLYRIIKRNVKLSLVKIKYSAVTDSIRPPEYLQPHALASAKIN